MISVSATTARSWTVRPLPANHRCLTSQVASVSSKVMSVYHTPRGWSGQTPAGRFRAVKPDLPGTGQRLNATSLLVALGRPGQVLAHPRPLLAAVGPAVAPAPQSGRRAAALVPGRGQLKPVDPVPGQRQQVAQLADPGEDHAAHALDRRDAHEPAQVQLDRLREPGQVVHAQ